MEPSQSIHSWKCPSALYILVHCIGLVVTYKMLTSRKKRWSDVILKKKNILPSWATNVSPYLLGTFWVENISFFLLVGYVIVAWRVFIPTWDRIGGQPPRMGVHWKRCPAFWMLSSSRARCFQLPQRQYVWSWKKCCRNNWCNWKKRWSLPTLLLWRCA